MKGKTKAILTVVCVIALLMTSALGSLAYLTDQEQTTNAFTFGKVDITLDEAELVVGDDGSVSAGQGRVQGNDYEHCVPGDVLPKDPTVHVIEGPCYVRAFVRINCKTAFAALMTNHPDISLEDIFGGHGSEWACKCNPMAGSGELTVTNAGAGEDEMVFEYWINDPVEAGSDHVLFETVTIPEALDNDDVDNLAGLKIDVIAQAIQVRPFSDAAAAWETLKDHALVWN